MTGLTDQFSAAPLLVDTFTDTLEDSIETVIEALPSILLALVILLIGLYVANRVTSVVKGAVGKIDASDQFEGTPFEDIIDEDKTFVSVAAFIVKFYVLVFAILIAAEVVGLTVIVEWAEVLVLYVPELIGGLVIILLGVIIADAAAGYTRSANVTEQSEYGDWIVASVRALIYFVVAVIGLEMIGFELRIIYLIVDAIASAIGLGIAAAIALAVGVAAGFFAKDYVEREYGDDD